ncbi:hypothetical protein LCGC14_1463900 [marine sediment metagenome]|uniref:Uncharacterized protein n=1 Tax=marine sediment metagenome TaxID=412755 RepID=A0A0F9JES7_9ZZZZ
MKETTNSIEAMERSPPEISGTYGSSRKSFTGIFENNLNQAIKNDGKGGLLP